MDLNVKNVAKVAVIAVAAMLIYSKWVAPKVTAALAKA